MKKLYFLLFCLVTTFSFGQKILKEKIGNSTSTKDLVIFNNQRTIEGFALYPNPIHGRLLNIISKSNTEKNINIFDVTGKQVYQRTTTANQINISNLKAGMYFVKERQDDKTITRKLVVE